MIKKLLRTLTNAIIPQKVKVGILHLVHSTLASKLPRYDMYSHIENLQRLGFSPDLIVDVGGYQGKWTQNVKKVYPLTTFLIVEAQKSKKEVLSDLFKDDESVVVESCLLGNEEKENVKFYEMETGSSIYSENTTHPRQVSFLQMKTLDSLMGSYSNRNNIFLKLDVQGAELDVLKGASDTLKKTEFILMELSTLNFNENSPLFADVISFMKQIGFVVFDICDESRTTHGVLFQLDVIFANENSRIRVKNNFAVTN